MKRWMTFALAAVMLLLTACGSREAETVDVDLEAFYGTLEEQYGWGQSMVDIEGEMRLLGMLDEIRREYDLSILLSTHDFATLEHFPDKVVLLKETVLKAGTPAEVLSSPEFESVFHLSYGKGEQA